ncbi:MAG: class I tRNA ligase family protein [archaeon]|jgi:leucyl-tRNA synthetase
MVTKKSSKVIGSSNEKRKSAGEVPVEEKKFDFASVEKKWQAEWEKAGSFKVEENSKKPKIYVLEMFPYPSGSGLHMGHALNYTIGDVFARFKRMSGFNVLYPMGYDAFGLPAENAAIKAGLHPRAHTEKLIQTFMKQQRGLGLSYDWSKLLATCNPDYYKWNQYFFLKFLEKGLAYRKKAAVNWCPKCETVLANEQVHGGKCWRHEDTDVEIRHLEQWFLKTTQYSDELLECLPKLQWPARIKSMQENWIGKSFGTEILFEIPANTNFVLLYGFEGSPDTDFHPWLKKELESRGYRVSVPKMPNTNDPNPIEQADYVLKNCKFDENTVLLGHSLGSVVALKVVEKLNKPIKKLILAAAFAQPGFKGNFKGPFEKKFDWKFDFEKIKKNTKEIFILRHSNDPIVPSERSDYLKEKLGGTIIDFESEAKHITGEKEPVVLNYCLDMWPIFTTRPDTIFGVTFMVVSAQHPRLNELVTSVQKKEVETFLRKIKSTSEKDATELEKEGAFTGSYAINPFTKEKIPIYAGNFVVADYGSGMVMAVPAHDQRDFEFAKKYKIQIKVVIQPRGKNVDASAMKEAFTEEGILVNSEKFNGIESAKAIEEITEHLQKFGLGKKTVNYKFRDWLISRQRYWGTPIPVVYCEKCGIVPVSEKDLPVLLPEKVEFGKGNPLLTNKEFVNVKCPKCNSPARRETDTMDTFFDSSWYFLRYCDNKNSKAPFEKKNVEYWMPVDQYIGGAEHACMHLIYARFFTKALRDLGFVSFDEPFTKLFNQGMLHGSDGHVMSKSRGNVVVPEEVSKKYGIDTARLFLLSQAAPDKDMEWKEEGIEGSLRVVLKIISYFKNPKIGKSSRKMESKIHKAIRDISSGVENFRYNFAIINLRQLFDSIECEESVSKEHLEIFIKLLHPICPHITEELWNEIGNKTLITSESWPKFDVKLIDENLERIESAVNGLRLDILRVKELAKLEKISKVRLFVAPEWKWKALKIIVFACDGRPDFGVAMKSLMEDSEMKKHSSEIQPFIKNVLSRLGELSMLEKFDEVSVLNEVKPSLEKEFGKIEIVRAEDSVEPKARNAFPGKPALLIE